MTEVVTVPKVEFEHLIDAVVSMQPVKAEEARHDLEAAMGKLPTVAAPVIPGTYWYLATPYTKYPTGVDAAWKLSCVENARLLKAGIPTYAPIAHSYAVAINSEGLVHESDWQLWMNFDHFMMESAKGCIVLQADTWGQSTGMAAEIATFEKAGKPIIYMTPGTVPEGLVPEETMNASAT